MTRRRIGVWLGVGAAASLLAFLSVDAFGAPAMHDIHSAGGLPITIRIAPDSGFGQDVRPSQSLAEIRCEVWRTQHGDPCPDAGTLALTYWPSLTPSPHRLYLGWAVCGQYSEQTYY